SEGVLEEHAGVVGHLDLAELAPGGAVIADHVVPLVVEEHRARVRGMRHARRATLADALLAELPELLPVAEELAQELRHVEAVGLQVLAAGLREILQQAGLDEPAKLLGRELRAA